MNRTVSRKHIHVACGLIEREGRVLAARRSAAMNLPLKWEFPGGKREPDESAEACLKRELAEEMGVSIIVGRPLTQQTHAYSTFTVTLYPFLCTIESGAITLHEHAAIAWLQPEELHGLDWAEADWPVIDEYLRSLNLPLDSFPLFDSHFHIIDHRFPLTPNNGYLPDDLTCDDYLKRVSRYDLRGGAIVSGSFQGFDQSYLLDALKALGSGFVGVTQLPATVSDDEIMALHRAGVRAVRFNLKRGGSEDVRHLDAVARRVNELAGWHVELYVDSRELEGLCHTLAALPAVSIDHLGLSKEGFGVLLKLVERGVRVKATGFGRVDFDVPTALREVYAANPVALMFGTDLPSTRAPRPYLDSDFLLVAEALGDEAARAVFFHNAAQFYRPVGARNRI